MWAAFLCSVDHRESRGRTIVGPHAKLVHPPPVISPEALEEVIRKSPILSRSIGELVTSEVLDSGGNEHTLIDVERCSDPLSEDVGDVIVGVSTVVQLGPESALPFLGGDLSVSIWGM